MTETKSAWKRIIAKSLAEHAREKGIATAMPGPDAIVLERPPKSELGDLGFPMFPYAKLIRAAPAQLAQALAAIIARDSEAKALGEVGLDYSPRDKLPAGPTEPERAANSRKMPKLPEKASSPEAQRDVFAFEVELAAKYGLPLNVHSRGGADRDALDILSRPWKGEVRGIAHGFDGDLAALKGWLDIGFSIALGYGQVIARPMPMLDDVVNAIPLDRLILESDGNPLVSPEGPLDVIPLAARIAAARKTEPELIGDIATTNLKRLLGI